MRVLYTHRIASATLLAGCLTVGLQAQPINDRVQTHLPLFASAANWTGTTSGSTGSVDPSCATNAANGVWYGYSDFNGFRQVAIDTDGSEYDTVLSVWRYSGGSIEEVACNDDSGGDRDSRIETTFLAGEYYLVLVSGYNGATGSYTLAVSDLTGSNPPHDVQRPLLDAPELLPGFKHPSTNVGVNPDPALTRPPPTCSNGATNDVWRGFRAPASGFITMDTVGSNFDTVLSIMDSGFTEVACSDDIGGGVLQSRISNFAITAGATYYVRVTGYSNAREGYIELNLSPVTAQPVSNEDEAAPAVLALDHARPNPAQQSAAFAYSLPHTTSVRIAAYDLLGREVAVLEEGTRPAGAHEALLDAAALPAGLYLVRLVAGDQVLTRRVTVAR